MKARINMKDWRNLELTKWTTATFRQYLSDKHVETYGIPYVARNYAAEAGMLKRTIDEFGPEATKALIDCAFNEYKPTPIYPSLNYAFIYSYMKGRILPRVLAELARRKQAETVDPAETGEVENESEWW